MPFKLPLGGKKKKKKKPQVSGFMVLNRLEVLARLTPPETGDPQAEPSSGILYQVRSLTQIVKPLVFYTSKSVQRVFSLG